MGVSMNNNEILREKKVGSFDLQDNTKDILINKNTHIICILSGLLAKRTTLVFFVN